MVYVQILVKVIVRNDKILIEDEFEDENIRVCMFKVRSNISIHSFLNSPDKSRNNDSKSRLPPSTPPRLGATVCKQLFKQFGRKKKQYISEWLLPNIKRDRGERSNKFLRDRALINIISRNYNITQCHYYHQLFKPKRPSFASKT